MTPQFTPLLTEDRLAKLRERMAGGAPALPAPEVSDVPEPIAVPDPTQEARAPFRLRPLQLDTFEDDSQNAAIRDALARSRGRSSKDSIAAGKAAARTGLPEAVVSSDPQAAKELEDQQKFDRAIEASPALTEALAKKPERVAKVKDDAATVQRLAELVDQIPGQEDWEPGARRLPTLSDLEDDRLRALRAGERPALEGGDNIFGKGGRALAGGAVRDFAGGGLYGVGSTAAYAEHTILDAPAQLAEKTARALMGDEVVNAINNLFSGRTDGKATGVWGISDLATIPGQFLRGIGDQVDPIGADDEVYQHVIRGLGQFIGVVAAAYATGGASPALQGLLYGQGATQMLDKTEGDDTTDARRALAAVLGGVWTMATETFAVERILGPLTDATRTMLSRLLSASAVGGLSEGVQEFLENVGHDVIQQLLTDPLATIDWMDATYGAGIGALVGAITGGVVGGLSFGYARDLRRRQEDAQRRAALLDEAFKATAELQLRQEAGLEFADFANDLAEAGDGPRAVYFDRDAFAQMVESLPPEQQVALQEAMPETFAQMERPALPPDLEVGPPRPEAMRPSEGPLAIDTIEVPLGEALLAGSTDENLGAFFSQQSRRTPDALSVVEIDQALAEADRVMAEDNARLMQEVHDLTLHNQSADIVASQIQTALEDVGFSAKDGALGPYVTLMRSFYSTTAARIGWTPEDLYEAYPVRFATPEGLPDAVRGLPPKERKAKAAAVIPGAEMATRLQRMASGMQEGSRSRATVEAIASQLADGKLSPEGAAEQLSTMRELDSAADAQLQQRMDSKREEQNHERTRRGAERTEGDAARDRGDQPGADGQVGQERGSRDRQPGADREGTAEGTALTEDGGRTIDGYPAATLNDFTKENIRGILDKGGWTILTAANPGAQELSEAENTKRLEDLKKDLEAAGLEYLPSIGKYGNVEPGFIIVGITEQQASDLGAQYGQESVLTRNGLVYPDGSTTPPTGEVKVYGTPPENFYTEIPGTGVYFSVELNFGEETEAPDVPADGFAQSVSLRRRTESMRKYGLTPGQKHLTRDVAAALEGRQRAKYGSIARDDRSPEALNRVAKWMAAEVRFELEQPGASGVGWYSTKYQESLDILSEIYPELATDQTARDVFTALLAITSDGQKVYSNFKQALDIYGGYRAGEGFAGDRGHARQDSIDKNLALLDELFSKSTAEQVRDYLLTEATVQKLRAIARSEGAKVSTAYEGHIKLPMAALELGPKLGAFYANLMGKHGYLTMDRWWSRTFNRYRGTLITAPTQDGLSRFRELMGHPEWTDDETISATVPFKEAYAARGHKNGTEIEKAANTIYKAAFENLEDSPFNGGDRTFMIEATKKAQKLLARTGAKLTIADIQAALWYYEKRLYGELGARQTADVSYGDVARRITDEHFGRNAKPKRKSSAKAKKGVPGDSLQQSASGLKPGEVTVRGVHFSNSRLSALNGSYYGMGLKGGELERITLGADRDDRLALRVYFYTMPEDGRAVTPERGVGIYAHEAELSNIYDSTADPLNLSEGRSANAFEVAVIDAGFDGYLVRDAVQGNGAVVLLGEAAREVAVEQRGMIDGNTYRMRGGQGLAQEPAGGREAILGTYTPNTRTITWYENAHLSTFLHEAGHFFLDTLTALAADPSVDPRLAADLRSDTDALMSWFGVGSLSEWSAMSLDEQRPYHEKFAEHFERYLFEGHAPSSELRKVFRKFKAFMLESYKSLRRFLKHYDTNLQPEVRAVMDRLLASRDEIAAAEDRAGGPVSPDASEAALEKLAARSLRDLKWAMAARGRELSRLQRDVASKRKAMREEVTAEVRRRPVYAALRFLKHGELPNEDGDGFTKVTGAKISMASLKEAYGEGPAAPWRYLPTNIVSAHADNSMPLQVLAEMLGFGDGDTMVREIISAPKEADVIDAETEQRLLEEHGDIVTQRGMEEAASEAVHNEARGRSVATDMKAMREGINIRVAIQSAKLFASRLVDGKRIRDLRPSDHTSAERKALRQSDEFRGKGDVASALRSKRDALLHLYAAKATQETRDQVEKDRRYLAKFSRRSVRKNLPPEYVEQIDALLADVGLRPGMSLQALDRQTSYAEWVEAQEALGLTPVVDPGRRADLGRTHFKNMKVADFKDLVAAVRNIEYLGRLKNKLLTAKDKRTFIERRDALVESIRENRKKEHRDPLNAPSTLDKGKRLFRGYIASHRKLSSYVHQLDGFREGGVMWELFGRTKNERADREATRVADATVALAQIMAPIMGIKARRRVPVLSVGESLTLETRIALTLNWGNEGNRERLRLGNKLDETQMAEIMGTLTAEELGVVQKIWDYVDSFWPEIAAKEERVSGIAPEKVQAAAFVVRSADGVSVAMRGGYYPIADDSRSSKRGESREEYLDRMKVGEFTRATTRRSHTKERVGGGDVAMRRDLQVLFTHLTDVIHDLTWHEWLIDTNRMLNDKEVDAELRKALGPEAVREIGRAVDDIAVGMRPPQGPFEQMMHWLRTGASIAGLGFNLVSGALQITGFNQSLVRLGPKYMARGVMMFAGNISRMESTGKLIHEKSEFMRNRSMTLNREMAEIMSRISGKSKFRTNMEASTFVFITQFQKIVDYPTWLGAYEQALDGGADEARAIAIADQVVRSTQGGGSIADLSGVERGSPFLRLFTNFYNFFNTTFNMAAEARNKTNFRDPKDVVGFILTLLMLFSVPAMLGKLMKDVFSGALSNALSGDDEKKKKYLVDLLVKEQMSYAMGTMVGLRDLSGALDGFSYSGPTGLRAYSELSRFGMGATRDAMKGELRYSTVKSGINTGAVFLHLPTVQFTRALDGYFAYAEGKTPTPTAIFTGAPRE